VKSLQGSSTPKYPTCSYGGDATDLPAHVLQEYLDSVEAGRAVVPIDYVYTFDQIAEARTPLWKRAALAGSW
jgi:hypothetical protein